MNCETFTRWLDEDMPVSDAAAAEAHARDCSECAAALEAARAVARLLAEPAPVVAAPTGFDARVMARVAEFEAGAAREIVLPSSLPWWARAAAEPAVVLAFVVAGLTLLYGRALVAAGSRLVVALAASFAPAGAAPVRGAPAIADPAVAVAIAMAALPFAAWAAWKLYAWSERTVMARTPGPERYLV
jgi:hypothetical protein